MRKSLIAVICALLLAACSDYDRARQAYEAGRYAEALQRLDELAKAGDTRAQYDVSLMYLQGIGAKQNLELGWRWMLAAARGGNTAAMVELGGRSETGMGLEQNYIMAISWYKKASAAGDAVGRYRLAMMYKDGLGVARNPERAYAWFKLSAKAGSPSAREQLEALRAVMDAPMVAASDALAEQLEKDPNA